MNIPTWSWQPYVEGCFILAMITKLPLGSSSARVKKSRPKRHGGEHPDILPQGRLNAPNGGWPLLCDVLLFLQMAGRMVPVHSSGKIRDSQFPFRPRPTQESLPSDRLQTAWQMWLFRQASLIWPEAGPNSLCKLHIPFVDLPHGKLQLSKDLITCSFSYSDDTIYLSPS